MTTNQIISTAGKMIHESHKAAFESPRDNKALQNHRFPDIKRDFIITVRSDIKLEESCTSVLNL